MNIEMEKESPEDIARKIAELELAREDDRGMSGEAKNRLNARKGALRKELHGMVSEEVGVDLVQAARERILREEEAAREGLNIRVDESDNWPKAA